MNLEDLADALRDVESCRKIVICETGEKLKIEALVLRYGMDHLWTVQESRHCPAGQWRAGRAPGGGNGSLRRWVPC